MHCLFDTDVVSEIHKGKNSLVSQKALIYINQHGRFTFSLITRYEVLRGLIAKRAHKQRANFEAFCQQHEVLPLSDDIILVAASVWAGLKQTGQLIEDNDILIAATALHHGLPLATRNVSHLSRVPSLVVDDWSQP